MKKGKAKKAPKAVKSSMPVVNRDITETIRSSYQEELRAQTQTVQSLKKTLKTLSAQLAKAISKRRVLKKKKMMAQKKAGATPRATERKVMEQIKKEYQASVDEVSSLQQSLNQARQDLRLVKEQIKKLNSIIRSIQKMEKRWDKAIAAKFRAKPKKKAAARKKKAVTVAASEMSAAPARRSRSTKAVVEEQPVQGEVITDM